MCTNLVRSGITVLVIEDSAPVRQRMLAELHEVREVGALSSAPRLAAALREIGSAQPDVVILDLQGNQHAAISLLKSWAPWVKVIVFTNLAAARVHESSIGAEAEFVINKAADFTEVVAAVKALAAQILRL